jgi:N-acyl-D-amino-acid deacylase
VRGDRIAAIGDLARADAARAIDAAGLAVCPGFIDIHTHSDLSVLFTPGMESSLLQGVTAEVVGNCGFSVGLARGGDDFALERRSLERGGVALDWEDLAGFLRRIEDNGVAIHVATLAGHGTLRKRAMGLAERAPDADEAARMRADLEAALDAGAVGLSSGLEYVPGMYAGHTELTALARVAAGAGAFYATHLRDEGDLLEEAVLEAIAVAEAAGVPLQLSHHKAEKPRNWGKVARTLALVDAAEARGVDVLLDQYPYTAYQTGLATIALPAKLSDAATRAGVRAAMEGVDYAAVEIASCPSHPEYQGHAVAELAAAAGRDPRDWVLDLLSAERGFVSAAHFALSEADVERVLADPRVMIGSDAVAMSPAGPLSHDRTHPRSYGTFARVLERYVREKGLLPLPEAIRRMTSLPARRLGWNDRGRIAPGAAADITVFDPDGVRETATFRAPHALAAGVRHVLVAGTIAVADGVATGARAGRVLRRDSR